MQLYLIRHPKPDHATGLCYGRRDIAVDAESVARAAAAVRDRIPATVLGSARIFSSPSSRCLRLARELAAPREPRVADDLAELNFGSWEGQAWERIPREQLEAWGRDLWGYRPGGVESAAMLAARWQRWLAVVRRSAENPAIAVTHAGVIRVALACTGLVSATDFAQAPVGFGSVHCIDLDEARVLA